MFAINKILVAWTIHVVKKFPISCQDCLCKLIAFEPTCAFFRFFMISRCADVIAVKCFGWFLVLSCNLVSLIPGGSLCHFPRWIIPIGKRDSG